jgi:outer membrane receptor protein involved in Fe transport
LFTSCPTWADPTDASDELTSRDRRLVLDLGAFYELMTTADELRTTLLINAGLAHSRGLEAELTALPVRNLTLSGSAVYAENALDSFANSAPTALAGQAGLRRHPFIYASAIFDSDLPPVDLVSAESLARAAIRISSRHVARPGESCHQTARGRF